MKNIKYLAIILCALNFHSNAFAQNAAEPPVVKIASPKKQLITEYDEYTGRFRATEKVEIRSRVSGYLQEVRFKDGQKVAKGDTLFIIDQRPLKIALSKAQAAYDLANKELTRAKGLRTENVVSQQALERVSSAYLEAKSALDDAKLQLDFSEIKSPISGRVSRHLVDVGNLITGGTQEATLLTTVVALSPIHFYFEVSEQDLLKYIRYRIGKIKMARIAEGAYVDYQTKKIMIVKANPVQVKLQDETEFLHHGRMDFVDNEIDQATGSIQGRAIFDNKDEVLLSGMFGRLRIAGSGEYEALLIPDEAVATNQNQKIVFMVNAKNEVEPHPVELGGLHQGKTATEKWRIVRSGLKDSDKIIWSGLAKVRPSMIVKPQDISNEVK
jgi:RND family efflux transporter MFP subunit